MTNSATNPVPIDRARRRAEQVPPNDLEAEESLLGTMLLSKEAIADAIAAHVEPGHFYSPGNGHVFEAITQLYARGQPSDVVTVADELRRRKLLDAAGGPKTLMALQTSAPSIGNAARYAGIVVDHARLRQMITIAAEIAEIGYGRPLDVDGAVDAAETLLFGLRSSSSDGARSLGEGLGPWLDEVEARMLGGGAVQQPSGFADLDALTGGLHPSHLAVWAARPGMGKTSVAAQMAAKVAQSGRPVLFLSVEMSYSELIGRMACAEAGVVGSEVAKGNVAPKDLDRLIAAVDRLKPLPIEILDNATLRLLGARAAARQASVRMGGLGLVIVDYVQLMSGAGRAENRQTEVAELARGLKVLAKELEVPVVALAQLNRGVETRGDKRPNLADLRESGELENSADTVCFIYRDEYYKPDSEDRGVAELIVAKNRHGPQGTARVSADMATGRWRDLAKGGGY